LIHCSPQYPFLTVDRRSIFFWEIFLKAKNLNFKWEIFYHPNKRKI
jgi:hypothetical protein